MNQRHRVFLCVAAGAVITACGSRPDSAREEVLAFFEAAQRGDLHQQMQVLIRKEEQTENGRRVIRALFPDESMRHFDPDSAVLSETRGDTAVWMVWGTGPNFERFDYSATREVAGMVVPTTREPTDAEIAALPRVTASQEIRLVRGEGGWKLHLHAASLGPLMLGLDSLDARCPYGNDPRPCRSRAERLAQAAERLPRALREQFGYLGTSARHKIQEAQAMDSIRLDLVREQNSTYSIYSYINVAVVNGSSIPLGSVWFRILDANGRVLEDKGYVFDLPANGRKEAASMIVGRSYPRPVRLDLSHVTLQHPTPEEP